MQRCTPYGSEREQLWELMEAECGLDEGWEWLEEEEKVKVLLGQDVCVEGGERIDSSVKSYLRKVMDKRRRWIRWDWRQEYNDYCWDTHGNVLSHYS